MIKRTAERAVRIYLGGLVVFHRSRVSRVSISVSIFILNGEANGWQINLRCPFWFDAILPIPTDNPGFANPAILSRGSGDGVVKSKEATEGGDARPKRRVLKRKIDESESERREDIVK